MLDLAASILTLVSMQLIVKKRASGWLVGLVGQAFWLEIAWRFSMWSMFGLEVLLTLQCVKAWLDWTGRKHWYRNLFLLEKYYGAFKNKQRVQPKVAGTKQGARSPIQKEVDGRPRGSKEKVQARSVPKAKAGSVIGEQREAQASERPVQALEGNDTMR